jgi:hypothetical protein
MKRWVVIKSSEKSAYNVFDRDYSNNKTEMHNSYFKTFIAFDSDDKEEAVKKMEKLNKLRSLLK